MHNKLSALAFAFFLTGAMVLLSCPAISAPQLQSPVISSGGATNLHNEGTPLSIHDLKGQSAAGSSPAVGNLKLDIGGLYGLLSEEKLQPNLGGISGEVLDASANNNPPLSGVKVTIYTAEAIIKTGFSAGNGVYKILNIPPGNYFIEASKNGYVTYYNAVAIVANQITTFDFSLSQGETAPSGTIGLMITRVLGTPNLKVYWTTGDQPGQVPPDKSLDIYFKSGETDAYLNSFDPGWIKIIVDGAVNPNLQADYPQLPANFFADNFTLDAVNNKLIYKNQFGLGINEAYFKGLVSNVQPNAPHPSDGKPHFKKAPAVGKINLKLLIGGDNLISLPLIPPSVKREDIIGDQLANAVVFSYDPTTSYSSATLTNGVWVKGTVTTIENNRGYLVRNLDGAERTMTVIGKVPAANPQVAFKGGNKQNIVGFTCSNKKSFANSNLKNLLQLGDSLWSYLPGQSFSKAYILNAAGVWVGALSTSDLIPGRGYYILRLGNDNNWEETIPDN